MVSKSLPQFGSYMNTLVDLQFSRDSVPTDWRELSGLPLIKDGVLNVAGGLQFQFPVPGLGWNRFRLELSARPVNARRVILYDNGRSLAVDCRHGIHEIGTYRQVPFITNRCPLPARDETKVIVFEWDHGRVRAMVDGQIIIEGDDPDPGPVLGLWRMSLEGDWVVHGIRMLGDDSLSTPYRIYPSRKASDFQFHVAIDFNSDVKRAPWSVDMFDQMFAHFESWGVTRCDYIWHGDGMDWAAVRHPNARITTDALGDHFPLVVKAAHAHHIELFGLFKPFEDGEYERYLTAMGERAAPCLMARKPNASGDASQDVFTRIDLVKEDADTAAFSVQDIRLLVSDDNKRYVPYQGPDSRAEVVEEYPVWEHTSSGGRSTGRTRRVRVMRFTGLRLTSRYVQLLTPTQTGSFANDLVNLIHVFGPQHEERHITLGVTAQLQDDGMFDVREWEGDVLQRPVSFGNTSVLWTPSANFPGYNAMATRHVLDAREGLIAFARGKASGERVMSPAYQETRDWWLSRLKLMLDAGADGIELRVRHHHSPLSWAELGFEPPVRRAFLDRHGVDLWKTDDFDKAAWRRLRGEAYSEFYRQASQLVRSRGKRLGLHIGPIEEMDPKIGGALDMHWDWRSWIDQGLADSVTMKELWPCTRLAEDVLDHTRRRGIPVIFSPFGISIMQRSDTLKICGDRCRLAIEHGFDGFQFYESAAILEATIDGRVLPIKPGLGELLRNLCQSVDARMTSEI